MPAMTSTNSVKFSEGKSSWKAPVRREQQLKCRSHSHRDSSGGEGGKLTSWTRVEPTTTTLFTSVIRKEKWQRGDLAEHRKGPLWQGKQGIWGEVLLCSTVEHSEWGGVL